MDNFKLEKPLDIKVKWNWTPTLTHKVDIGEESIYFSNQCIVVDEEAYYVYNAQEFYCATDSSKNYTTTKHVTSGGWRVLMDYEETVYQLKQEEFDKLVVKYPVILSILQWIEKQ